MRPVLLAIFGLIVLRLPAPSQSTLHLVPTPGHVQTRPDQPLPQGVTILCTRCDADDRFAAEDLRATLSDRGVPVSRTGGSKIVLRRAKDGVATQHPEGYTIRCIAGVLTVSAEDAPGVFYGAQTVKQMIERTAEGGFLLHTADIEDWPAMKYRGLHDDLSRGPVDTLEFQKKLVRTLATYKANVYSPYLEVAQNYKLTAGLIPHDAQLSADDARDLVAYAKRYHVMVIPEQESFGHLHKLLREEQFAPLAETPHGNVLAPNLPGSLALIQSVFSEMAAIYPAPFMHIGGDETMDLGLGQSRADVQRYGVAGVYLDFMKRVDTALRPLGKRLLFWGDIAQNAPDLLRAMPASFKQDTLAVAWEYSPHEEGFARYLSPFRNAGFETWVAPGLSNWSRLYPNYRLALKNIQQFTRDGQAIGTTGQLNTLWNDDGETLASNNWFGILFGAAAAWQRGESSIEAFQAAYGSVFHGDRTGQVDSAQRELMFAHATLEAAGLGDGSNGLFWMDPWSAGAAAKSAKLRPVASALRLHAERALESIAKAREAADLRETDAVDAMELAARRFDFVGMQVQLADEIVAGYSRASEAAASHDATKREAVSRELFAIHGADGRMEDIRDAYAALREMHRRLWLATNRSAGLRTVLAHYDLYIALWWTRIEAVRNAQREWSERGILPPALSLGIPTTMETTR